MIYRSNDLKTMIAVSIWEHLTEPSDFMALALSFNCQTFGDC